MTFGEFFKNSSQNLENLKNQILKNR